MRALREFFAPRSLVKFILLLVAMNGFASGLTASLTGIRPGAFLTVTFFAAIFAWILAFTRFQSGDFWILLLAIGGLFIFIEAAQLWGAVGAVFSRLLDFQVALIRVLFKNPVPSFALVRSAFDAFLGSSAEMLQRILAALQTGSLQDVGVRELLWDVPILLLAAWAGWTLKRRDRALLALGPSLGLVAYILYYTGTKPSSLQLIVGVLLLLMGISEWEKRVRQKTITATLEKASADVNLTLIILSLAITLAAGFAPSVTLRHTIDRIQQDERERKNQQMAASLGLEDDPNSLRRFATATLPRQHLIGGQPATSQTVVFTVKTGDLPPMPNNEVGEDIPRYYWRSLTYDIYTGRGWETTLSQTVNYAANQQVISDIPEGYRVVHLDINKTAGMDSLLYWSGTLVSVDQAFQLGWRALPGSASAAQDPFEGGDALGATIAPYRFQVESVVRRPSIDELRAATSQDYPNSIKNRYLALPDTLPERVRALAAQVTDGITNPYDQAAAIEAYLRRYPYSLNVPTPPKDRDVADYFLFTLGTGYCDYYATSMVVMARSLGLPARLVSGFATGAYLPASAQYVVREADAHSWPEIYFSGIGWVEFEPTAGQPEIERPQSAQPVPPAAVPQQTNPDQTTSKPTSTGSLGDYLRVLGILLAVVMAAGAAFYSFQAFRFSRADITQIYPWVFKMGSRLAPLPGIPETPMMFAERLREFLGKLPQPRFISQWLTPALSELEFLTRLYIRAVYSPHRPSASEDAGARHIWRKLYWRLWLARILRGKVRPERSKERSWRRM